MFDSVQVYFMERISQVVPVAADRQTGPGVTTCKCPIISILVLVYSDVSTLMLCVFAGWNVSQFNQFKFF